MTENVVTLVVVCYNHAPFLERCLESVASQSSDRFDLIVTDDASQDGSPDLIQRELARHGLQARLILHQRNVGVCATSNEALALVRTPLVAFLSTDDWMTRNDSSACRRVRRCCTATCSWSTLRASRTVASTATCCPHSGGLGRVTTSFSASFGTISCRLRRP